MSGETERNRQDLHLAIEIAFVDLDEQISGNTDFSIPYLAGAPGGGKTESIRAKALKLDAAFISRNLGLARLEEFGGIPDLRIVKFKKDGTVAKDDADEYESNELHTIWSVPELISEIRVLSKVRNCVICLLDDWHLAPPDIQALGYELFSQRSLKGYEVPDNCMFLLAGNDTSMAGARTQFSAIMNRVAKTYVKTSFEYWRDNFAYNHNIYDAIPSFLGQRENTYLFHGKEDVTDPWASPRSWTKLSTKILTLQKKNFKLTENDFLIVCESHVGLEAASKFVTYHDIYIKFDTDRIYSTGKFTIPTDPVDRFAFGAAISSGVYNLWEDPKLRKWWVEHTVTL